MLAEIIIFFLLAAFILFRLYLSLGKEDIINISDMVQKNGSKKKSMDDFTEIFEPISEECIKNVDENCLEEVKNVVNEIRQYDRSFILDRFLKKTELAFEDILDSFYKSDLSSLSPLVSKKIYNYFETKVKSRNLKEKRYNHSLIAIKNTKIVNALYRAKKSEVEFCIEFRSEQVNFVVDNKTEEVISGSKINSIEIRDLWSFSKNIKSKNPVWLLSEIS
ncbi:Tim44/TimA family putative adaptor protein [Anaplasmataceae bacterium AB001_6]|nr:Tim44/TimA family putative adaptor protein [Anaplasmataceae bacterium AB001_6]